MEVYCFICGDTICKYELDFNSTGAIAVTIKSNVFKICNECAKLIAKRLIDDS